MKVYLAGRFHEKDFMRNAQEMLRAKGHEISWDWTKHKNIRPYPEHLEEAEEQASADIQGVKDCDIFILLSDEAGRGMYVELGVAVALQKKIFIVGEHNTNCLFYFLLFIIRKDTLEDVLKVI